MSYPSIARPSRPAAAVLAALLLAAGTPSPAAVAAAQAPAVSPAPVAAVAPPGPAVEQLRRALDGIVRGADGGSGIAVMAVSLDRGDTLYARGADLPLAPASNMKLFSTAAAFYYLGSDFRYTTYLLADGPVRDGVLDGDLILYGTGDPSISGRMLDGSLSAFRAMADSLRAAGVREVRGDLVGDGSYFDDRGIAPGWQPGDLTAWYGAPVGALSLAENLVSVQLRGASAGSPATVSTTPATVGLAIRNQVRTVAGGRNAVRIEQGPDGLVATGQLRPGARVARTIPVVDPASYAAAAMHAVLRDAGIRVTGGTRSVRDPARSRVSFHRAEPASGGPAAAPAPRVVALHRSPLLAEIAAVTNHVSHNLFAEALFKTVGRVVTGEGSFAGGARAVGHLLTCETAADSTATRIVDGSGLSRSNRVTARTTIHLLDFMTRDDGWAAFYESLPEAGNARGLRRMQGTAAAGNLRAKTGTLRNVSALAGYVRTADGERVAFSVMANGVGSTARAKRTEDAVGAALARFRREALPGVTRPGG